MYYINIVFKLFPSVGNFSCIESLSVGTTENNPKSKVSNQQDRLHSSNVSLYLPPSRHTTAGVSQNARHIARI